MINTAKCLYCGLVLSEPCKTADASEDCSRKPCEPSDPDGFTASGVRSLHNIMRDTPLGWARTPPNPQRYRK